MAFCEAPPQPLLDLFYPNVCFKTMPSPRRPATRKKSKSPTKTTERRIKALERQKDMFDKPLYGAAKNGRQFNMNRSFTEPGERTFGVKGVLGVSLLAISLLAGSMRYVSEPDQPLKPKAPRVEQAGKAKAELFKLAGKMLTLALSADDITPDPRHTIKMPKLEKSKLQQLKSRH